MLKITKTTAELRDQVAEVAYKLGQVIQLVTILIVATVVLAGLSVMRLARN